MIYLQATWPCICRAPGTFASHIKAAEERGVLIGDEQGRRAVVLAALQRHHAAGVKSAATRARNLEKARKDAAYVAAADAATAEFYRARENEKGGTK